MSLAGAAVRDSSAAALSSRREWIPSFVNTPRRCHSTVRGLMKSCAPISTFVQPSAASLAIWAQITFLEPGAEAYAFTFG